MLYIIKAPQLSKNGLKLYYSKLEVFGRDEDTGKINKWIIKNGKPVLIENRDYIPRDITLKNSSFLKKNYSTDNYWTKYGCDVFIAFETMEEAIFFKKELLKELKKIIIERQKEFDKLLQRIDNTIKG